MYSLSIHEISAMPSISEFLSLILILSEEKENKIMYNVVVCIRISPHKWMHFTLDFTYYWSLGVGGETHCQCLKQFIQAVVHKITYCLHGQGIKMWPERSRRGK